MGRIGISYQDVAQAIVQIQGRQESPTVDRIREVLGTGSRSTISRLLREWKAKHNLLSGDNADIPSELLDLIKSLWSHVQDNADDKIQQALAEFTEKESSLTKELQTEKQEKAELRKSIQSLEENLHQKSEKLEQARHMLQASQMQNSKLDERLSLSQSQMTKLDSEKQRMHELVQKTQNNLEHYQAASQAQWQQQTLDHERQRKTLEQEIIDQKNQITEITQNKMDLQSAHNALESKHKSLSTEHHNAHSELDKLRKAEACHKSENELLQADLNKTKEALQKGNIFTSDLQLRLEAETEKNLILKNKLEKCNDMIETIKADLQFIKQEKANLAGQLQMMKEIDSKAKGELEQT
jgi:chromosome segregation ATPase